MVDSVPFTDLGRLAQDVWPAIRAPFMEALLSGRYIGGDAVAEFESQWAAYCGADHAVGVANGTDAIELTLEALGIGRGDEVVVPANTFVATAEAVVRAGATPRFADVDDGTLLLTAETVRRAITPRTAAVIVVHLYGQMPDMDAITKVTRNSGLVLVEDAAQAHGATWRGGRAGSFGVAACFSFYPGKNLGAFGDAGAVVTSDRELAERVRTLANHGRSGGSAHYEHELVGTNSRLDTLQAIVLQGKLTRNEEWTEARIALAGGYATRLAGSSVRLVERDPDARHVYHLLVARTRDRDRIRARLADHGIVTGVHYPTPCHQQPAFACHTTEPMPVAERAAAEIVSLPLFPHMTDAHVERVCEVLDAVVGEAGEDRSELVDTH